ncbi:MAG: hypothetical protein HY611_07610, partial [Elusimicrobia bacterium]|nr:hypothetical protein [Elusimicrobiota bacterium]
HWSRRCHEATGPIRWVLENRYGFDEFFLLFARAGDWISAALNWFDNQILDRLIVDGFGAAALLISRVKNWFDNVVIDGAVDGTGYTTQHVGGVLRLAQTGYVQNYLLYVALGVSLIAVLMLI